MGYCLNMPYKNKIAARAALEMRSGQVINLGIGIPNLILDYLPTGLEVFVQSENGILGIGPRCAAGSEDRNLIDAGANYVTLNRGASFFDSALSFALIRGGRVDLSFLGTLEVSQNGDLANWIIPGKMAPGIGGGMELAQKAKRVIVTTSHTTRDGGPKILTQCSLPLTARGCVKTIITELAVIDVTPQGLMLREIALESSLDEVQDKTAAPLLCPPGDIPRF
jgi:3-oxoacid CoA-transferase B subunit